MIPWSEFGRLLREKEQTRARAIGYDIVGTVTLTKGDGTGTFVVPNPLHPRVVYYWTQVVAGLRRVDIAVLHPASGIPYMDNLGYERITATLGRAPGDSTLYILWQDGFGGLLSTDGYTPLDQLINSLAFVPLERIATLRVNAAGGGSMFLVVDGPWLYIKPSTGAIQTFNTATLDLTSSIPGTANQHRLVLVTFNTETGTLAAVNGTASTVASVPSRDTFVDANFAAFAPGAAVPVAFVYAYNGQAATGLVEADIYRDHDPRLIFQPNNYQIIQNAGSDQTQRGKLNLVAGANVTITPADDSANNRTTVTIAATGGGSSDAQALMRAFIGI